MKRIGIPRSPLARLALAAGAGLIVGMLTAYGQGWLGHSTGSLVNSAGPWSLAAFAMARLQRRRVAWVIASAVAVLVMSEVGYVVAAEIRGDASSTSTIRFWLTAAVLAGPPLGVAASWSTRRNPWRAMGIAVVGGVLIGEAAYGWIEISDTTEWRYWAVELAVGLIVVTAAVIEARRPLHSWIAAMSGAATAAVVFGVATTVA